MLLLELPLESDRAKDAFGWGLLDRMLSRTTAYGGGVMEPSLPRGLSKGTAERWKNRGPFDIRPGNIWLGGGTSAPRPKVAEKVGMGFSLDGKSTFSTSLV